MFSWQLIISAADKKGQMLAAAKHIKMKLAYRLYKYHD